MANLTLTAQNVLGDPFVAGGNITIVNNAISVLTFVDVDHLLNDPLSGEFVSFDNGATLLSYEYLGNGNVRGDPLQNASFIRIDMGDGTFTTIAIDMNADFDQLPNLQNGNVKMTVGELDDVTPINFPGPACFTLGTMIETITGDRRIETLEPGDMIMTADKGYQPLLYLARKRAVAKGRFAPVRIARGALGNARDLLVSQQHRMLISGWKAELVCGQNEVLVSAKHLVNDSDIHILEGDSVEYIHLLFADHEVVYAEGIASESFFPGPAMTAEAREARSEALMLFPELATKHQSNCQTARCVARATEAHLLAA